MRMLPVVAVAMLLLGSVATLTACPWPQCQCLACSYDPALLDPFAYPPNAGDCWCPLCGCNPWPADEYAPDYQPRSAWTVVPDDEPVPYVP